MTISYPVSLIETYEKCTNRNFDKILIDKLTIKDKIEIKKGHKIRIKIDQIKLFFTKSIEDIISKVNEVLLFCKKHGHTITNILMVGGYSDSQLLRKKVKEAFGKDHTIVCPPDRVSVVMRSAAMFGRNPDLISERMCPRTYGISVDELFDNKKHSESLKSYSGGRIVALTYSKSWLKMTLD